MAKLELISIGNTKFKELIYLEEKYLQKINFFVKFTTKTIKDIKIKDEKKMLEMICKKILEGIDNSDYVVLLDRVGKKFNSINFSKQISKFIETNKKTVFIIGNHLGVNEDVKKRADMIISFSDLTISHDIFKILFLEQLYRAFTIIKGIKYHR